MDAQLDTVRPRRTSTGINPACRLEVDGGIAVDTIAACYAQGRILCGGLGVFGKPDGRRPGRPCEVLP